MCLHPESIPPVPEVTARVAKAVFPKGNRYMRLSVNFRNKRVLTRFW